jgi:hypothetical protein
MEGLVTLILLNIAIPGAITGVAAGIVRRRSLAGILANLMLGTFGGIGGGLLAIGLLEKMHIAATSGGLWLIWAASAVVALMLVGVARSVAIILTEATERAA